MKGISQKYRQHTDVRQRAVGTLEVGRWFESRSFRQLAQLAAKEDNSLLTQKINSFGENKQVQMNEKKIVKTENT